MISHVESKIKNKPKKNGLLDTENRLVVARDRRVGEVVKTGKAGQRYKLSVISPREYNAQHSDYS